MRVVSEFPHRVRVVEHLEIPLADGGRLAARLWLPEGAGAAPVPALVEYIPYGKREGTRQRDTLVYFVNSYYVPIRDAIERRFGRLYCGKLVYETKVKRGFTLLPLSLYLCVRGRARRAMLEAVAAGQRSRIAGMTSGFPAAVPPAVK